MRKLIAVILAVASIVCTTSSLAATSEGTLGSRSRNDKTTLETADTNVTTMPAFRGGDTIKFDVGELISGNFLTVISYKLKDSAELTDATIQYIEQYTMDDVSKTVEYTLRDNTEEGIYKLSFSGNETTDGSGIINFYYKVGNPKVTMMTPNDATAYWNLEEYTEGLYAVGFVAKAVIGSNEVSFTELGVENFGITLTAANGKTVTQKLSQENFEAISQAQKVAETTGSVSFVYGVTVYGIDSIEKADAIRAEAFMQDKENN